MKRHLFTLLFFVVISPRLFAQLDSAQIDSLKTLYIDTVKPSGIIYFNPGTMQPGDMFTTYKELFLNDENDSMALIKSWTDDRLGMKHDKYQLYYSGYRVEACQFIEHYFEGSSTLYANGKVTELDVDVSSLAIMPENIALDMLLHVVDYEMGFTFAWEDTSMENMIKADLADPMATFYPKGELVWALDENRNLDYNINPNRYTLAWEFTLVCLSPSFNRTFYVDAVTGQLLKFHENRHKDGPANTHIYGWETIDTKWRGGIFTDYVLQANDNDRDFETRNYGNSNVWSLTSRVDDDDDNWGGNRNATSVHYNIQETWNYFRDVHGLDGMDDDNIEIRAYANYNEKEGAFWEKSGKKHYLLMGDLAGDDMGRALDVVAHEYTHGVTFEACSLKYEFESGALNESFSDIFGVVVEAHVEGGLTDWLTAEDAFIDTLYNRSLENPKIWGSHADSICSTLLVGQPNTYEGEFWWDGGYDCDNGGVHINSGVQNHWFYLLANGGSGWNDNNDFYNISGIGLDDAADIAFWSLTNEFTDNSEYDDARDLAIEAAIRIFGECSNQHVQTQNAWYAVGIGDELNCNTNNVQQLTLDFAVYPNPTNGQFSVQINSQEVSTISIFSVDGRLIRQISSDSKKTNLDLSHVQKGVYLLKVSNGNKVGYQKIILQ